MRRTDPELCSPDLLALGQVTLALMYWMMSSNNSHASSLTSSGKGGIQQQIEEQESGGASRVMRRVLRELRRDDACQQTGTGIAAFNGV